MCISNTFSHFLMLFMVFLLNTVLNFKVVRLSIFPGRFSFLCLVKKCLSGLSLFYFLKLLHLEFPSGCA